MLYVVCIIPLFHACIHTTYNTQMNVVAIAEPLLHVDDVAIACRLLETSGHGVHCHKGNHFILSGGWVWRGCKDCDFASSFGSEGIHSERKYCPKESTDRLI